MTAHDPLCTHHATPYVCDCNFIARVRADERERLADLARKVQGGGIRDYEAEVRERIAQEIEAASERLTAEGYDTEGFDYCAAIARIARGDS